MAEKGFLTLTGGIKIKSPNTSFVIYNCFTLYQSLAGNLGHLTLVRLRQLQKQCFPVLQVHAGVFSCFSNPPNSDMDYMVFNVCTWSFLFMCVYTHRDWAHWQRVSTTWTWKKTDKFFLCSWWGSNSGYGIHWIMSLTLYQLGHSATWQIAS